MAADVTLIAVPDRSLGQWSGREVAAYRTYQRLFEDETPLFFEETGEMIGLTDSDAREEFDRWFYDQLRERRPAVDIVEIGPWSPMKSSFGLENIYGGHHFMPEMQVAVFDHWRPGLVVTPASIAVTMALMNIPDSGSIYRRWGKRGTGRGKYRWRSNRTARRRVVKQWLSQHVGDIVWAESW